jgi:hypothetical protein
MIFFSLLSNLYTHRIVKKSKNIKIRIYRTIILPVVLYGWETWCLTLREEHRLRVFKNRVLRGIFGPKRDEVIGGCRKLHNEELDNVYWLRISPPFVEPKVRYCFHKNPTMEPILSQLNPVYIFALYAFNIQFNTLLLCTARSLKLSLLCWFPE